VAGALDVQLGGNSSYFGEIVSKPTMGDANGKIRASHLGSTVRLMLLTSALFFALGALLSVLVR
jgi:adenosylcobinamide-phosphate synthase